MIKGCRYVEGLKDIEKYREWRMLKRVGLCKIV